MSLADLLSASGLSPNQVTAFTGDAPRTGTLAPTALPVSQTYTAPFASMQRTGTSSVQAPVQQQAPGNPSMGSPATNSVSQVGQPAASVQQLAIANAINQYLAQQAAAKKAAYDSSVPGQTQNMINNQGVFAGRQAAAPASSTAPPALPQLQTTQGLRPMGGV